MATLRIDGSELVVELSTLEKVGALSGGVRVPLSSVRGAHVTDKPYRELRGVRVGTGVPFVVVLGRMIYFGGKDFVAIYGTGRTVIVELAEGAPYKRIFVSSPDERIVEELRARAGSPG
jgi:hypothetical protein